MQSKAQVTVIKTAGILINWSWVNLN